MSISCPSASVCFASGAGGITGTADGGQTWSLLYLDGGIPLPGISCPSPTICFTVGYGGTILATMDAGQNWSAQTSGTTSQLFGVSCASTTFCVAVGGDPTILVTTDGGSTWKAQAISTADNLAAVSCPTIFDCVAVGNAGAFVSHDGALTWTYKAPSVTGLGGYVSGVTCSDGYSCHAVNGYGVYDSVNGANSWSPQYQASEDVGPNAIACTRPALCVAVGFGGFTANTFDAGSTWTMRGTNSGYSGNLSKVSCPSAGKCVAVGNNGLHTPELMQTNDWGTNWSDPYAQPGLPVMADVSCESNSNCVAVNGGSAMVTVDGGATWAVGNVGVSNLVAVSCVAGGCIAVGGGGAIAKSTDGGASWFAETSGTTNGLSAISCPALNTCFAVGQAGTILATTDGTAWVNQTTGTASLSSISCPATTTCYVVGPGTTNTTSILSTSNGGATWTTTTHSGGYLLDAISCPGLTTCFAVGGFGALFTTTDGINWTPDSTLGTSYFLYGISCPRLANCYAVGEGTTILASNYVPPPGTVVARPGLGQALLSWVAPDTLGAPITGYVVVPYTNLGFTAGTPQTFNSSAAAETVTGLTNGVKYWFKVSAITAAGPGPPSPLSNPVIVGAPGAPQQVRITPGNGSVTVSWQAPADIPAPVTQYTVTASGYIYSPPDVTTNVGANQLSVTLTGLMADCQTYYQVDVTASNNYGTGPSGGPSSPFKPSGVLSTSSPPLVVILVNGAPSALQGGTFNPLPTTADGVTSYCAEQFPWYSTFFPYGLSDFMSQWLYSPAPPLNTNDGLTLSHLFLSDPLAAQGAVLLPFSYRGAQFVNGDASRFQVNAYGADDSGNVSPTTVAGFLDQEVKSINGVWGNARIVIIGHSNGGLVAEQYWEKYWLKNEDPNHNHYGVTKVFSLDGVINGLRNATFCVYGFDFPCDLFHYGPVLASFYHDRWMNSDSNDSYIVANDADGSYQPIGTPGDPAFGIADYGDDGLLTQLLWNSGNCTGLIRPTCNLTVPPGAISNCPVNDLTRLVGHFVVKWCLGVIDYIKGLALAGLTPTSGARSSPAPHLAPPARKAGTINSASGFSGGLMIAGEPSAALDQQVLSAGETATLSGSNLGSATGKVIFSAAGGTSVPAAIGSWSATSVSITVPTGAVTGRVDLVLGDGESITAGLVAVLGLANGVAALQMVETGTAVGGQAATITVTAQDGSANPVPNAPVSFFDGLTVQTSITDASGNTTFHPVSFGVATFVAYSGAASASLSVTWQHPPPMSLAVSAAPVNAGNNVPVTITATLTDASGQPVSGQPVSFQALGPPPLALSASVIITDSSGTAVTTATGTGVSTFIVAAVTNGDTTFGQVIVRPYVAPPTAPMVAVLPAVSNGAYGGYVTTATIENTGTAPASVRIAYFDQNGAAVGAGDTIGSLPVNGSWTVRQDNGNSFPSNGGNAAQAGSAIVYSDQPVAVFVNEFAPGNVGDATSYSGVQVSSGVGTTLFAPTIVKNAYGGYTTGIGLLNQGSSPTDVTITYRDGSGSVVRTQTVSGLAAHAYRALYSGDSVLALPSGFAGTATITSTAAQPLGAIVNETGPGGQFSSYDAVPSGSTTLYAPAALRNAYGGYNTGMGIQNTTGTAGMVTINYYNSSGTPTTTTAPISANGYLGVYQGTDIATAGAYTATITSTVAIAGIVNEVAPSTTNAKQSTAYNAVSTGSGTLHFPLVENAGSDGWTTGDGIMNTGTTTVTVTVSYYDTSTGAAVGTPQSLALQPNAFWGLYQPSGGLPSGARATAVITTSPGGQVAAICNESNSTSFMSYGAQ